MVETVISERDIAPDGEQLIILLGFRTTNKTNGQVEVKQLVSLKSPIPLTFVETFCLYKFLY